MKFHITTEETRRAVYEVEAKSIAEARAKFMDEGGKLVSEENDVQGIEDIEPAE